ncbi:hypothetical protein J41TS12_44970 [Paenibacillus antibioticophila]|uniref:Uncharacterized protein n=1 Tax=Paenibacillus antibioticophila TaxID=1274374 RepID=A0A919XUP7_9BACL|nr:hypothetical protein J41TS12_44970 [Paenibacillus antibioticophila]
MINIWNMNKPFDMEGNMSKFAEISICGDYPIYRSNYKGIKYKNGGDIMSLLDQNQMGLIRE